jgi:hypothetical protein
MLSYIQLYSRGAGEQRAEWEGNGCFCFNVLQLACCPASGSSRVRQCAISC